VTRGNEGVAFAIETAALNPTIQVVAIKPDYVILEREGELVLSRESHKRCRPPFSWSALRSYVVEGSLGFRGAAVAVIRDGGE